MTVFLTVILAALHFEHHNLVALYERVHYLGYYFCAIHCGRTDCHCSFIVYKQHTVEFNSLTGLDILHVIHKELFACLNLKLMTVNLYDCVHFVFYIKRF